MVLGADSNVFEGFVPTSKEDFAKCISADNLQVSAQLLALVLDRQARTNSDTADENAVIINCVIPLVSSAVLDLKRIADALEAIALAADVAARMSSLAMMTPAGSDRAAAVAEVIKAAKYI